jgi:hypothetical protein
MREIPVKGEGKISKDYWYKHFAILSDIQGVSTRTETKMGISKKLLY